MRRMSRHMFGLAKALKAASAAMASAALLLAAAGCDVHEFPEPSGETEFVLRLKYETDLPLWNHVHEDGKTRPMGGVAAGGQAADSDTDQGAVKGSDPDLAPNAPKDTVRGVLCEGTMRYTIKAFPVAAERAAAKPAAEFVFERDVADGYDCAFNLTLPDGDYRLMVWSDFSAMEGKDFYETGNFRSVELRSHEAGTDYRDAFRGRTDLSLESGTEYHLPDTVDVAMQRPLAKFEFVTTDLSEFIATRLQKDGLAGPAKNYPIDQEDLDQYRIVLAYHGYKPTKFNMESDKPVDSETGVFFESRLRYLGGQEASLGFDYVFVNTHQTSVSIRVGVYTRDGTMLSVSDPIEVPLIRSRHTVIRGKFLTSSESGDIGIDPGYSGDFNIHI